MVLRSKISYHTRLFLLLLSFLWSIVICFLIFQYTREKQFRSEFINAQLQTYNNSLLEEIKMGVPIDQYIASHREPFDNLRVSVISTQGNVLYDNSIDPITLGNHLSRSEVASAIRNGSGYHIARYSESDGRQYFYSATSDGERVVRSAIPYSSLLRELLSADWAFLWVMLVITVIMSIIGFFATRSLGQTITRLNRFAESAEQGREIRYEEFPHDELGEISKHIVSLYTHLQQTIADRDREHESALREEQDKIRLKRQLTNNINHELKTPVASIQVCLETLLSEVALPQQTQRELLERSYANCERLRHLLADVSLITRLDEGNSLINKDKLNLAELVSEVVTDMQMRADSEHIKIDVEMPSNVMMSGNQSLLSSIFRNLSDNAIAYSEGTQIKITLRSQSDGELHLTFEDNGQGVPPQHLPHLFERFYRVDKGRSRKAGGTGLGLSIVKHAVQFHGGTIVARIGEQGGLRFDFTLKSE